jgi:general stress protein 26
MSRPTPTYLLLGYRQGAHRSCHAFDYLKAPILIDACAKMGKNSLRSIQVVAERTKMTKPAPLPIDPARLVALALAVVKTDRFPDLATMDGDQPRVRPVSPVRTDLFTVYVANLRDYHKTQEIAANPKVELCYLDGNHDQVRITGLAEQVVERPLLQQIWDDNPLLRQYLGSLDNPQLIVYRIKPTRVRYIMEWALEYINVPFESAENAAESPTTG